MDFKRVTGITFLVAAAIVFACIGSMMIYEQFDPDDSPYWWVETSYTGKITQIDKKQLTIGSAKGPVVFQLDSSTHIVLKGATTLAPGQTVQVKYKDNKGQKMARGIRILQAVSAAGTGSGAATSGGASSTNGGASSTSGGAPAETTGPSGDSGPKGDSGPTGDSGPAGDTGATGSTGVSGDTGSSGMSGPTGDMAPSGATGK